MIHSKVHSTTDGPEQRLCPGLSDASACAINLHETAACLQTFKSNSTDLLVEFCLRFELDFLLRIPPLMSRHGHYNKLMLLCTEILVSFSILYKLQADTVLYGLKI